MEVYRVCNDDVIADRYGIADGILGFLRKREGFTAETRDGYVRQTPAVVPRGVSPHPNPLPRGEGTGGFSLVELLVVVTIIVVLLALLVPALGRAIYQARLAECAGRMKTTAGAVQTYAFDFKRFYPDRQLPTARGSNAKPAVIVMLASPNDAAGTFAPMDIRPQFKGYLDINKQLNDPFVEQLDLASEPVRSNIVNCSYNLWFGLRYEENNPNGRRFYGMERLGDHWEFQGRRYGLLMGDVDIIWSAPPNTGRGNISASHTDFGPQPQLILQTVIDDFVPVYGGNATQSYWIQYNNGGPARREPLDMNYAYDDGSVQRLANMEFDDERYDKVPYAHNSHLWNSFRVHIPKP